MVFGQGTKAIADKLVDIHRQLVTTEVKFEGLQELTRTSLQDFRSTIELCLSRVRKLEDKNRELLNRIDALEHRLTMLSEGALHVSINAAAEKVAKKYIEKKLDPASAADDGA